MDILAKLFGRSKASGDNLNQSEREAILDLLLLCSYGDNHLSLAEDNVVKSEINSFTWDSGSSIEIYMNSAIERARRAAENEATRESFLEHVKDRLASENGRMRALASMEALFVSDGRSEKEKAFAAEIRALLS